MMMRNSGRLLAGALVVAVGAAFFVPGQNVLNGPFALADLLAAISAIGALGTAAFGLVDATKALPGAGLSQVGWSLVRDELLSFDPVLQAALGKSPWQLVIRAHWVNGRPRDEQKAIVKSLLRLGLNEATATPLAKSVGVDTKDLVTLAAKLHSGAAMTEQDINLLGRVDATIDARLDGAYDLADQRYRNLSRVAAGLTAVVLSLLAASALGQLETRWPIALFIGLIAVPVAPIAKDLASSLQTATAALRGAEK